MASAGSGYKLSLGADGPPGLVSGLRPRRPVLRDRREHGRLPSDPVPAHDGPGEGGREADRRRPAPHRHRRQGRPVPADQARHRSRAAQRPAAPAASRTAHTDADFIAEHTEGWDAHARLPRRLPAATRSRRSPASPRRTSARAARWIGEARRVDELLDHGPQPEHARHLEHQRDLQPAPGHRRDLPPRQRAVLAHRPAQRDGRPRDGLHGARVCPASARCSSADDRAFIEDAVGHSDGHAPDRRRARAPSTCSRAWPPARSRRAGSSAPIRWPRVANRKTVIAGLAGRRTRRSRRTPSSTRRPTATPTSCLPGALWAEAEGVMVNSERNLTLMQQAIAAAGHGAAGLADHRAGRRARWASATHFSYDVAEEVFDEITRCAEPEDRLRPARRELRAAARDAAAVAVRARRRQRPQSDPLPQRRRQPGPARRRRRHRPRLAFPTADAAGRCSSPARTCPPAELPDDDYPDRAQHRPAAAPVAHDDQDRQGREAQQAQPGPVRRDPSRRRRRARHRRRTTGRDRARAAAARCCPPSSPTGCGRATASRRSTGTTCSAST